GHHRHGIEPVDVEGERALGEAEAAHEEADEDAGNDRDDEALGHRYEGDPGGAEYRSAGDHAGKGGEDAARLRHVRRSQKPDDDLPGPEDEGAARELERDRRFRETPAERPGGGGSREPDRRRPGPHQRPVPRQTVKRSSSARPRPMRAKPRTVMTRTAANRPAVSKFRAEMRSSCPIPLALRKNSAATIPTRARPIA